MLRAEAAKLLVLELGDRLALGERLGHRLAVQLGQLGLVVEQLEVRGSARLVEMDDPLGLGREMQGLEHSAPAVGRAGGRSLRLAGEEPFGVEREAESQRPQARGGSAEEGAPGPPLAHRLEIVGQYLHRHFLSGALRARHDRVMSSGRFKMARATEVQPASSSTFAPAGSGAWPMAMTLRAACGSAL